MTGLERPWTPEEAALWFSVSEVTIRRWVREGRLRRIPTGGALRITAASVAALTRGYDDADGESQGKIERGPFGTPVCDRPRTE
jgi:excisionase family DNA binding protein